MIQSAFVIPTKVKVHVSHGFVAMPLVASGILNAPEEEHAQYPKLAPKKLVAAVNMLLM